MCQGQRETCLHHDRCDAMQLLSTKALLYRISIVDIQEETSKDLAMTANSPALSRLQIFSKVRRLERAISECACKTTLMGNSALRVRPEARCIFRLLILSTCIFSGNSKYSV